MYDVIVVILETLILFAILGEWRTSHLHRMDNMGKKQRANTKRKATKLLNSLLGDK